MDYESTYLRHYNQYHSGNTSIIMKTWELVKPATIFYRLYDSSRALTKDDFNSLGLIGVNKAFITFDPSKNLKLSNWLIILSNQHMSKGINFDIQISHFSEMVRDQQLIDSIMLKLSESFDDGFVHDEFFKKFVNEVSNKLYNINRKAYELFKLRVNNMEEDTSWIMNKLGISASYYKYFEIIKKCSIEAMNEL